MRKEEKAPKDQMVKGMKKMVLDAPHVNPYEPNAKKAAMMQKSDCMMKKSMHK